MRTLFLIGFFLCFNILSHAQVPVSTTNETMQSGREPSGDYNPLTEPNTYQSTDNPLYWKNQKPNPGYWQQDVHYKISAKLDDQANAINGKQTLTYWNNSPDMLEKVYFHLYQNAFQPGSYYHQLKMANNNKPRYGLYEKQGLGTVVKEIKMNGETIETTLDNTILICDLPEPIKPGEKVKFTMEFKTFFGNGSARRRMDMYQHHGVKQFKAVHWYPRIAVYDRKMGWQTDQHLGKEFYGDYGTFDVSLTLPEEYIVQGTGNLENRKVALPETLLDIIALENYQSEETGEEEIQTRLKKHFQSDEDSLKTWKYHAENVHDFAFTADPKYRMGIQRVNDIRCIALVQAHKAGSWTEIPEYTATVVQVYQEKFGPYPYPKVVVADARDGMEYPMITLCSGKPPYNYELVAHEVGHMWYQSAVGNNEAYRAAMDEGFTQMLTTVAMDEILGAYPTISYSPNWYTKMFQDSISHKQSEVYTGYVEKAIKNKDARLNVHSHKYNSSLGHGGGYRQVYYKMGTMLFNLQYVLGESRYENAMKNYFKNWRIAHPYPEDFRHSIHEFTDIDLTWFFDQWMESTKTIDYQVKNVRKQDSVGNYTLTFQRKGKMEMPLAFTVYTQDGEAHQYLIPNRYAHKETEAEVLPKWTGWGEKLNTTYQADINVGSKIENVVIDPSNRLGDVNRTNNSLKGNIDLQFDSKVDEIKDINQYQLNWRPEVWYNQIDGLKGGIHLNGNYLDYKNRFHFTAWYNSGILEQFNEANTLAENSPERQPINVNTWYKTPITSLDHDLFLDVSGRILDGYYKGQIGLEKSFGKQDQVSLHVNAATRPNDSDLDYLLYPNQWEAGQWNNAIDLEYHHQYNYFRGSGDIEFSLKSSALGSDYDYTRLNLTVENDNYLGNLEIKTRTHFEYTLGNEIAPQSKLYLAGGNPEKMMENKFVRSRGFFPNDWLGYGSRINHFHYGGGLNLRGYSGYLAPFRADNQQFQTFTGNAGAAFNLEAEFDRYVDIRLGALSRYFHLDTYLFGDIGIINYNDLDQSLKLSKLRGDAGIGTALTVKQWGPLKEAKPLTLRFDMPLYLSHRPASSDRNFAFRWLLGVERSF